MTLPNPITRVFLDEAADDPRQARAELAALAQAFNDLLTHLGLTPITQNALAIGEGLEQVAGALRVLLAGSTLLRSGSGLSVNVGLGANQIPILDSSGRLQVGTINANLDALVQFRLSGVLAPTILGANTHNFNPANLSTKTVIEISSSLAINLTGIQGGISGRILVLDNVGAFAITLTDDDAASTAANRFRFGSNFILQPGNQIALRYKASASRWVFLSKAAAASGWTFVDSVIAAGGETELQVSLIDIPADAREAYISWYDVQCFGGTGFLQGRLSLDNGVSYDSGSNYMEWGAIYNSSGGAAGMGSGTQAFFRFGFNAVTNTALTAAAKASARLFMLNPRSGHKPILQADIDYPISATANEGGFWRGTHKGTPDAIDGFQLFFSNSRTFVAGGVLEAFFR